MRFFIFSLWVAIGLATAAHAQPVSNDSRVQRIDVEEPGRTNIRAVYRVTISEPLEEPELRSIAQTLKSQVLHTDAVGVRFVLPTLQLDDRDPAAGKPFYAWRLMITSNKTDIFHIAGISPSQAAKQIAAFKPTIGDKLRGIWIDHAVPMGVVALVDRRDGIYFLHLADADQRFLLKKVPSQQPGTWFEAVQAEAGGKRYKADGAGASRVGVHLHPDGSLRVHGSQYRFAAKPWLIAQPQKFWSR